MKKRLITILGIVAPILSLGVTLINDWVSEQHMDDMINEKIEEALSEREEKES